MRSMLLTIVKFAARALPVSVKQRIYQMKPLAEFMRTRLNKVMPNGIADVEIAGGLLYGYRLALDMQTEKDYWLGTYESELQECITNYVKPGWTIYDVGANIGYISLVFAKIIGERGKVFAFEALPENITRLKENIALNNKEDVVILIDKAVIDSERFAKFFIGPSNAMGKVEGSVGKKIFTDDQIVVKGISLDEFLRKNEEHPPDLIKIDIEGGEVLALKGMKSILQSVRPIVLIEVHGKEAAKVVWQVFSNSNYRLRWMKKAYPRVNSLEEIGRKAYLVAEPE